MSIKNINVVQNPEVINDIQNEYIQSLANLGQRVGIKNDSIKYKSFKFIKCYDSFIENKDVLKFENIKTNINNYVGYIQYDNLYGYNTGKIGIIDKQNLLDRNGWVNNVIISKKANQNNIEYNFDEIFGVKFIENDFEFQNVSSINNIENYLNKSILKIKDNNLYTLLFGNIIKSGDSIEVAYSIYDLSDNRPKKCIRLFYNDNDGYYLFEYDFSSNKLKIYYLDIEDGYIKSDLNMYLVKNRLENVEKKNIIRLLNNLITNNEDTIFNYFYDYGKSIEIKFVYDTEENTRIVINNLSNQISENNVIFYENENENIDNLIEIINIRTNYINNDNRDLFVKFIEYYHNFYFCKNQSTLILRILESIYESLISKNSINYENNLNIEFFDITTNKFILYFPLDYEINYICNRNNPFDIFYSNDIFINKINLEDTIKDNILFNENIFDNIVFSSNLLTQSIFEVHNVKFNYNSIYNDFISYISTNYCYSLPYIDIDSTNWIINGQDSGLTSYLLNNNLQNIMIINTFKENDEIKGEYLNNINNSLSLYFNDNDLKLGEFKISKSLVVDNSETTKKNNISENYIIKDITIKTALPKINNNNSSEIYSNTLVVSISPIISDINVDDDFLVTSVWKFNTENSDWDILKDKNSGTILDLSKFLNLGLIKERNLNAKSYIFNYLGILLNKNRQLNLSNNNEKVKVMAIEHNSYNNKNDLTASINFYDTNLSLYNNIPNTDNLSNDSSIDKFLNIREDFPLTEIFETISNDIISDDESNDGEINVEETNSYTGSISITIGNNDNNTQETYSSTTNVKDYIFDENVPIIDLGETFLYNTQILNRLDFTTLDKKNITDGNEKTKFYHTFIGPDYDKSKRDIFCIKSSKSNKNIGTKSLMDKDKINEFDEQSKLLIEFDNIELKGNLMEFESIKEDDYVINKYSKKVSLFKNDDIKTYIKNVFNIIDETQINLKDNFNIIDANNYKLNKNSNVVQSINDNDDKGYYLIGYSIIFEKIEIIQTNKPITNIYNIIVK